MTGSDTVTKLLHQLREGNKRAIGQLISVVYSELHRLAEDGQREAALQLTAERVARQLYSGPRVGARKNIFLPRALCTSGYVRERLGERARADEA